MKGQRRMTEPEIIFDEVCFFADDQIEIVEKNYSHYESYVFADHILDEWIEIKNLAEWCYRKLWSEGWDPHEQLEHFKNWLSFYSGVCYDCRFDPYQKVLKFISELELGRN